MRTAKEFWNDARIALGFDERGKKLPEEEAQMERDWLAEEKAYQSGRSDPDRIQSIHESDEKFHHLIGRIGEIRFVRQT